MGCFIDTAYRQIEFTKEKLVWPHCAKNICSVPRKLQEYVQTELLSKMPTNVKRQETDAIYYFNPVQAKWGWYEIPSAKTKYAYLELP